MRNLRGWLVFGEHGWSNCNSKPTFFFKSPAQLGETIKPKLGHLLPHSTLHCSTVLPPPRLHGKAATKGKNHHILIIYLFILIFSYPCFVCNHGIVKDFKSEIEMCLEWLETKTIWIFFWSKIFSNENKSDFSRFQIEISTWASDLSIRLQ